MINIDPIIEKVKTSIENHKLPENGYYSRYTNDTCANEYGCADAANLLYTINEMPTDESERSALVNAIRSFQNKDTGLFSEPTHHPYHCTAHCIAALELFDALPLYHISEFDKYDEPKSVPDFLKSLNWQECQGAHLGAGLFSSMFLTRRMSIDWQNEFIGWLDKNVDEKHGVNITGAVDLKLVPKWHHMGEWFHFLFCYHACHRKFPCEQQLVDYCIELYKTNDFPDSFGKGQRFLDIDWAFTINRASLSSGYRREEVLDQLKDFATKYTKYLLESPLDEPQWDDMHLTFGAFCALSELQIALPGFLVSTRPLRQVLDRRPFI